MTREASWPRRVGLSSITSSCRSVAEWVSSAATANGTARFISAPQAPQERSATMGRIRLPPADTRCLAAAWSRASASLVAWVSSCSSAPSVSKRSGTPARAAWARSGRTPRSAVDSSC